MNKPLLTILLLSAQIVAGNTYNDSSSRENGREGSNLMFPSSDNMSPQYKRNEFEINIDSTVVDEVSKRQVDYVKAVRQTNHILMSQTPIIKPFKSIDNIYITTEYQTVLVFPPKFFIVKAKPSTKFDIKDTNENIMTLLPKRDFIEGNILVTLYSKETGNILTIINIKKYLPQYFKSKYGKNKYADGATMLSSIIRYVDKPNAEEEEILEAYLLLNGEECNSIFQEDGNFDTFLYQGILYYLTRDDKYGTIEYEGINYRISNNPVVFGEKG